MTSLPSTHTHTHKHTPIIKSDNDGRHVAIRRLPPHNLSLDMRIIAIRLREACHGKGLGGLGFW